MILRPYQQRAVDAVHQSWQRHRSVCLVAPTGAGKTVLGTSLARAHARTLWLAHRKELVGQAAATLAPLFPDLSVTKIQGQSGYNPACPVAVASVQTLVKRPQLRPPADLVVFDECHHAKAEEWEQILSDYPNAKILGLTATPERRDGKPLGDVFQGLVVAAQYSELLRDGHLTPCRVYQPPSTMGRDLALDPLTAYKRHCNGDRAFVFVATIPQAKELAEKANAEGIHAACVTAKTSARDREQALADFAAGSVRLLTNVYALTEGVDVPAARACIIARNCEHAGMFLQIAGRVLRPHPDKTDAILIDLTGATIKHGLPTADRAYGLLGKGISAANVAPVRNCLKCGCCYECSRVACPQCGYQPPVVEPHKPRIYSLELREVFAGVATPYNAKKRELERLMEQARARGWQLYFVQKEYKKLFGEPPLLGSVTTEDEQAKELSRLLELARKRGYKPGFAAVRFRDVFGSWPSQRVRANAESRS